MCTCTYSHLSRRVFDLVADESYVLSVDPLQLEATKSQTRGSPSKSSSAMVSRADFSFTCVTYMPSRRTL